ncbi:MULTISPECIES: hypothetical protein [Streptomyces]|uniref:Uncharacterized protein n=1 Tax=Streptomyces misionensis TaxID=67331 RepID=A0A1H5B3E6_9ACTN|nr:MULTISPECIES: hypothetical protein [Streptomyces]SED48906.1 hypothetical protein SAMN04490357_4949 [Streptomyces misionensis]SFY52648.1 hypothetical protein STEPF1_05921 [Streptomyces sp. F-1]
MNTMTSQPVTLTQRQKDRFITGWSLAGILLLLPIVVLSWMVVLSGDRGSRCLTYGEQCSTIPGSALYLAFFLALGAGVAALAWPRGTATYARATTVFLQWGAQLVLGAMILDGA